MPLVVICGQPCSGKSTVAAQLVQVLQARGISNCNLVDEPSLHLIRNAAYKDVPSEKNTRALLKSTVERYIGRKEVTILDSINNIKGFRYELWCITKAAGTRYCMVHVDTPVEQCKAWNAARHGDKYDDAIFNDLACRFERPDARNRWDAPLFTVNPGSNQPSAAQAQPPQILLPPPSALPPPQQPPQQLQQAAQSSHAAEPSTQPPCPPCQALAPAEKAFEGPPQAAGAQPEKPTRSAFKLAPGMRSAKLAAQAQTGANNPQASMLVAPTASIASKRTGLGAAASVFGGMEASARGRASEAAAANTALWVNAGGEGMPHPGQQGDGSSAALDAKDGLSLSSLTVHDPGLCSRQPDEDWSGSVEGIEEEGEASTLHVLEAIAEAMVGVPAHVSMGGTCLLTPSPATTNPSMLGTNLLHDIDQAAQDVVDQITEAQVIAAGGAAGRVDCGRKGSARRQGEYLIHLDQPVTLAELRRHKRAFLKVATKVTFARLQDGDAAKRTFLDYLISNVPGASRPPQAVF